MKGLLFTYLLTYGGVVVSLFNPFVGLLIYVCFAIVKPESLWFWSVPQGNYSRIVAIGLLAGWALNGFGNWRLGRARLIVCALIGYWLWAALLAATTAQDQEIAWHFVELHAKILLPFLVGITVIDSMEKVKALAWVIVGSQGYVALEFNLAYLNGFNWVREGGFADMDNNSIAIALVSCVGPAFFLGLHARLWWQKAVAFAAAALLAHAVLFSFSRGGVLSLIVTAVVAFLLIPKRPQHALIFALAILLVYSRAGPEVVGRFETSFASAEERDDSAESRLGLWSACLTSMGEHPWGLGPDHWPLVAADYGFSARKEAHSLWLQTGAELGYPGLFCLVAFYGLCMARLWPVTRERFPVPDSWCRHVARMVIASLGGFVVAAQFVSLKDLELPFYVTLVGASVLKLLPAKVGASTTVGLPVRAGDEAHRATRPGPETEARPVKRIPFPTSVRCVPLGGAERSTPAPS
jgi:O-antigen ligase